MHRLKCTSGLDMALALALLAALGSSCSDSRQAPNSVVGGEIRRFTDTYNTFVGWEWIVNQENLALGVMKGGVLSDFQHKIHDFGDGEVFRGGEFFCDPDDIIFLPKTQEVAYLPYLSWSKDLLVNNNGTFGRLSYLYQPDNLTKKSLPGAPGLSAKIGMRIDKTLSAEHGFLDSRVYIINNTEEPIDVVFITQDAAYMFLPDGNQEQVIPFIKTGQTEYDRRYFYGVLSPGDVIATYHETRGFAGGYVVQQGEQVFGGVIPEYAFFTSHSPSDSLPGFADVHRHGFNNIKALNRYLVKISKSELEAKRLKNRILVFSFTAVEPGETVVARFYQVGGGSLGEMKAQLVDAKRAP